MTSAIQNETKPFCVNKQIVWGRQHSDFFPFVVTLQTSESNQQQHKKSSNFVKVLKFVTAHFHCGEKSKYAKHTKNWKNNEQNLSQ